MVVIAMNAERGVKAIRPGHAKHRVFANLNKFWLAIGDVPGFERLQGEELHARCLRVDADLVEIRISHVARASMSQRG